MWQDREITAFTIVNYYAPRYLGERFLKVQGLREEFMVVLWFCGICNVRLPNNRFEKSKNTVSEF